LDVCASAPPSVQIPDHMAGDSSSVLLAACCACSRDASAGEIASPRRRVTSRSPAASRLLAEENCFLSPKSPYQKAPSSVIPPPPQPAFGPDTTISGMLLADLVAVSEQVAATPARNAKIAALAALLERLRGEEVEITVDYLAGRLRQGR